MIAVAERINQLGGKPEFQSRGPRDALGIGVRQGR